MSDKINSNNYY